MAAKKKAKSKKKTASTPAGGRKDKARDSKKKSGKTSPRKKASRRTGARPRVRSTGVADSGDEYDYWGDQEETKTAAPPSGAGPEEPVEEEESGDMMSLGDHLEELRKRIFGIIIVLVVSSVLIGVFFNPIHSILKKPFFDVVVKAFPDITFIQRDVTGQFFVIIKLAVAIGSTVSLPIVFSILWRFVTPAVSRGAAWVGHSVIIFSSALFWGGMFICWKFIFPLALKFLLLGWLDDVKPMLSIESYYGFLLWVHIGAGIGFQLPLVITILGAAGILTADWHKRNYRYFVVGIFVFGAVVTPPDPTTQVILASSLCTLYGISILIVWLIEKMKRKRAAAEEEAA